MISDKDLEHMIKEWERSYALLKQLKKDEMGMRIEIAEFLLEEQPVGSHKFTFGEISVKINKKVNYNILADELDLLYDSFSEEEKDCIKLKPLLSISKYKELEESDVIDECIVVTPATPTIEVLK